MADPKETLKKKIDDLKGKLAKQKEAGKDLKADSGCRELRKSLKRAQRRLTKQTKLSHEVRNARVDLFLELIGKKLSDLQGTGKKTSESPYVHSLRKRVKSLNKQKKRLDREAKRIAAKKLPATAEGGAAAPAESK